MGSNRPGYGELWLKTCPEWWRGWESWEAAGDLQGRKPPGGPRWWLSRGQMGRGERTVALAGV